MGEGGFFGGGRGTRQRWPLGLWTVDRAGRWHPASRESAALPTVTAYASHRCRHIRARPVAQLRRFCGINTGSNGEKGGGARVLATSRCRQRGENAVAGQR